MADIEWLVDEVENGPQGPQIGAFFDFDGTLIDGFSAAPFFRERIRTRDIDAKEIVQTLIESVNVERRGHDVTALMDIAVQAQAGKSIEDLESFGRSLFQTKIASMVYPDSRTLIDAHLNAGHTVVIASSATPPQVEAAAEDLGVDNVLCTELEVNAGMFTGLLAGPVRWGQAKADAVEEFAAENDIDLTQSYTYSNGSEDVPFLSTAGHPRPLNPDNDLETTARERGWPVASFKMPHRHNPITLIRSAAALGALGFGVAAGATTALLNADRSTGAA
ncbi:MAG: HAD-IB family hydrolase, partial [Candidatus Nanopelagicales bacterium]